MSDMASRDLGTSAGIALEPRRVQRSRTKGWRMPPNTLYVGRPSMWGNPYRAGGTYHAADFGGDPWSFPLVRDAAHAVELFRARELDMGPNPRQMAYLRGKNLCCWCALDQPCHADVLLELANSSAMPAESVGPGMPETLHAPAPTKETELA